MTFGAYEDRFRRPTPSWHQILMAGYCPNRKWRRRRRYLVAASLFAAIALIMEIASHHAAHSRVGRASARDPAFGVLPRDFWRILDRVRSNWDGGGPSAD